MGEQLFITYLVSNTQSVLIKSEYIHKYATMRDIIGEIYSSMNLCAQDYSKQEQIYLQHSVFYTRKANLQMMVSLFLKLFL